MSGHNQTYYKLKAKQFKNKEEVLEWADQQHEIQEKKEHELCETIAYLKEEGTRQNAEIKELKLQTNEQAEVIRLLTQTLKNLQKDAIQHLKEENYFVCKQEDYEKTLEELGARNEAQKGQIISQHDEEDSLYWGATNGYLTIFRLPKSVNVPDDCDFGDAFGNKWCLGEEWGGLTSACFQTITQEMIVNENFEQEQGYSDSEDDSDNEDLECVAWCKPISEGREPEERDADEFLSTKQKCPSCELERQEIIAETVQEMAVRIIAEQVKKQEENGEAEASDETEEGCCSNCGLFMPEDMHIFCFTRGEEDWTMCCECGQDLHEELKADGWRRDDDSEDEDDE